MWRFPILPSVHLIHLQKTPIFEQLQLEEALLRSEKENFCLINQGSQRAVVMGISNDPNTLLDLESIQKENIPIIRRFSGGGTVIVDENTLFITLIFNKEVLPILPFPEPILQWSSQLYEKSWNIPHFSLKENDYCIREKKCGGNAQYIQKQRWLHHTSFLWDYSKKNMQYLLLPSKQPKYREKRSHEEFLTPLKEHAPSIDSLIEKFKKELEKHFALFSFDLQNWEKKEHRKTTHFYS